MKETEKVEKKEFNTGELLVENLQTNRWKKENKWASPARNPKDWELVSPELLSNSQVNLGERDAYIWYISRLNHIKQAEIKKLADQMAPLSANTRAVVAIPAYKEGRNIYLTLSNYANQSIGPERFRIVVLDNPRKGEALDNTREEVLRFKKDNPKIHVDFLRARFDDKVVTIGHVRNMLTAAIIKNAASNRQNSKDLILISNDADMPGKAVKSTYVEDIIEEFDSHPRTDAIAGKINMPEAQMAKMPTTFATKRLWDFMTLVQTMKGGRVAPYLVGRNTSIRLKTLAAVGNYDPELKSGEDVDIGEKIRWIRSWNGRNFDVNLLKQGTNSLGSDARIRYVHKIGITTDPRRDMVRAIKEESIFGQYQNFAGEKGVWGENAEDLVKQGIKMGLGVFSRERLQKELNPFYKSAAIGDKIKNFDRAMGFLGVKWTVIDGEFRVVDTRKLERGIIKVQLGGAYHREMEEQLGRKIKGVSKILKGESNYVFDIELADGKHLIAKVKKVGINRLMVEKRVNDVVKLLNIPISKISFLDLQGKTVPGQAILISEKLPGKSFERDFIGEKVVNKDLLFDIGAMLKKIHSTSFGKGWGMINNDGNGNYENWNSYILAMVNDHGMDILEKNMGIDKRQLREAVSFILANARLLNNTSRQLLHGDFTLANILTQNNKISGIIDWENATFGDPIFDIARFVVYERNRMGGSEGVKDLLSGYGEPNLLKDGNAWRKYQMYKLFHIVEGLLWYGKLPGNRGNVEGLKKEFEYTLNRIKGIGQEEQRKLPDLLPVKELEIESILKDRFNYIQKVFGQFYWKVGVSGDREFVLVQQLMEKNAPVIEGLLRKGDFVSLANFLKKDKKIAESGFSDKELLRQSERIVRNYKENKDMFKNFSEENPLFRLIAYLSNRGHLSRYVGEYDNLPSDVQFKRIVLDLASRKSNEAVLKTISPFASNGTTMKILDEGPTIGVGLQQLAGYVNHFYPQINLELSSISADKMSLEFSDCHRFKVNHKVFDAHRLDEAFGERKQTLIVSQATYKFFLDPLRAIVKTANLLEKNGWAFIGDIRDKTTYPLFEIFLNEKGQSLDPQRIFAYLNSLDLGYTFHTGMHTSMRDGEPRKVMTLAIKKSTDKDLNLPIFYVRPKGNDLKGKGWSTPLRYLVVKKEKVKDYSEYTKV